MSDEQDPCGDLPAPSPFLAPRYHFGMLLGAGDFETEQGYHRGKSRLHNAWLHGRGVVYGFGVSRDLTSGEVRVAPGLALDGAGRELFLPAEACVHVGEWYAKHEAEVKAPKPAAPVFPAHVVARFRACFTRQVPALAQPCGPNTDTAYSRVAETVELLLRPGPAKAPPAPPFPRLREAFAAGRPGPAAFRALADADATARTPAASPDGAPTPLFPETDADAEVVLANLTGVTLQKDGAGWKLTAATVDTTVREVLVPTATIQELLAGAGGPRVVSAALEADNRTFRLELDQTVIVATLSDASTVTSLPANGSGKWSAHTVESATADSSDQKVVRVKVGPSAIAANRLVRLVVRGTGPTPVTGTNLAPLDGGDFVFTTRRN